MEYPRIHTMYAKLVYKLCIHPAHAKGEPHVHRLYTKVVYSKDKLSKLTRALYTLS